MLAKPKNVAQKKRRERGREKQQLRTLLDTPWNKWSKRTMIRVLKILIRRML